MIHCHGCGQQIHETAPVCPKCGAPQNIFSTENIPAGVKGWSWGAFLLNWIWAIGNKTWIGLLALVPVIGLGICIWLGIQGREMAWKNKQWKNLEHFNRVQKKWSQWAVGIVIVCLVIGAAGAVYQAYEEKLNQAAFAAAQMQMRIELEAAQAKLEKEEQEVRAKAAKEQSESLQVHLFFDGGDSTNPTVTEALDFNATKTATFCYDTQAINKIQLSGIQKSLTLILLEISNEENPRVLKKFEGIDVNGNTTVDKKTINIEDGPGSYEIKIIKNNNVLFNGIITSQGCT